jgi:type II secretory pathway predicted ATPase ExeA
MYEEYWGLKEKPFQNTPDPRFLYYSPQHEEALVRLTLAIEEQMGAAMLTGVFGCGKTLLGQALLEQLSEGRYRTSLVTNPQLNHLELLRTIAYHLGATKPPLEKTDLLNLIEEILFNNMRDGKDSVVIIDEAHVIEDTMVFEELRLLLNYQLQNKFLLTLLLFGQPELRKKVDNIKQLEQRIAIKCHLDRLGPEDTQKYIIHRLEVAEQTNPIFSEGALDFIYQESGGIPRRINNICTMSLLVGFGRKVKRIDEEMIKEVARDSSALGGQESKPGRSRKERR